MFYRAVLFAAALLFSQVGPAAAARGPQLPAQPKVRPPGMPAGFVMVNRCVATMGEHWANLKAIRTQHPITMYGTYQGKPIFTEIMLLPKDLAAGKSFSDVLRPLPGYRIDHTDIGYLPHGHPGMTFAHYAVRAYYLPHAVHARFCPGGEPAIPK